MNLQRISLLNLIVTSSKEKRRARFTTILIPEAHPPLTIKWQCDQCIHKEYLGPMDTKQLGSALLQTK